MELGVFIPINNNGWIISAASPQYVPSFELNRRVVEKAEAFGFGTLTLLLGSALTFLLLLPGTDGGSTFARLRFRLMPCRLCLPQHFGRRRGASVKSIAMA